MYDPKWNEYSDIEREQKLGSTSFVLKEDGPVVFDAADFLRLGRDIFG